ncbi:MAG: UDP-N-acetylmuramate--L-alanine ligase [Pseudomonadota bacterium]|nr:UDP-N-acetylmuramate--L-alanine ligase [Pseudomonadota bacterium]
MKHALQHLHFTGIGGAGMSAVAEILLGLGYRVSGSDLDDSAVTRRLRMMGAVVHLGHAADHVADSAQAVVVTAAATEDNPEIAAARSRGLPVVPRAALLAELMRRQQGIAIAGTHGKTTTTALVARMLIEAGLDPSYAVGGKLQGSHGAHGADDTDDGGGGSGKDSGNGHLGQGEFIVVEADESDASFLLLNPVMAVVTNIDADHLQTYGHSLQRLQDAFVDFIHRLPFYGCAIVCSDDPGVQAVLPRLQRPVRRYGLAAGADVRAINVQARPDADGRGGMGFDLQRAGCPDLPMTLNLAGVHNVSNALAAIAVAMELQLPDAAVQRALHRFHGVGRRFERHGELPTADGGTYTLIDDYGHHPVELAAVLAAARAAFAGRRVVLAFQPHRYSRTRDCMAEFVTVFKAFDLLLLAPVYGAGETPIAGADGAALMQAVQAAGHRQAVWVADIDSLAHAIVAAVRDGDVVLTMGAGTIDAVPQQLRALAAVRQATAAVSSGVGA